jgi:hypothetical protein
MPLILVHGVQTPVSLLACSLQRSGSRRLGILALQNYTLVTTPSWENPGPWPVGSCLCHLKLIWQYSKKSQSKARSLNTLQSSSMPLELERRHRIWVMIWHQSCLFCLLTMWAGCPHSASWNLRLFSVKCILKIWEVQRSRSDHVLF